jgi:GxxExxY protein
MHENQIGQLVVDSCIAIHRELGSGLLEKVYETVLMHQLSKHGLQVKRQTPIPIQFQGLKFEEGFRADLIIENKVILELKSIEAVKDAHKKQLLTYLKLTNLKLGYLLNFGESLMKKGITRIINGTL